MALLIEDIIRENQTWGISKVFLTVDVENSKKSRVKTFYVAVT